MMMAPRVRPGSHTPGAYFMLRALVVLAVAAAWIWVPAADADTTQTSIVEVPLNVSPFDPCTGEFVDLHGSLREVVVRTTDASGGFHEVELDFYFQLTGTGELSGDTYRFISPHPFILQEPSSGAVIITIAGVQVLLSEGSSANLVGTATTHVTISPTGQVTSVSNFDITCRG
jgi:hypothetical protein